MQKRFDNYVAFGKERGYITHIIYPNGEKRERQPNESYMTNELFEKLISEMKSDFPSAYEEYFCGNGGELSEKGVENKKTGVTKITPPKMASYASSSLMTYLKFRHIPNFKFEYKLNTTFGSIAPACLDGFLEKKNEIIFIESKCHEIYGNGHYPFKRSSSYFKLYRDYISNLFKVSIKEKDNQIEVYLENRDGQKIEYFELSQIVCHFLGIGKYLENKTKGKKIKLVYFLYSPLEKGICDKEILERYESIVKEIESIDFNKLFNLILDFLRCERDVNIDTGWDFSFKLCHQNDVLGELE